MTLNKEVTIGNLVSWSLILAGLVAGYSTLRGNTSKALETATEAKISAVSAQEQINKLQIDIAVIKATTNNTDKNVDEIKRSLLASRLVNN